MHNPRVANVTSCHLIIHALDVSEGQTSQTEEKGFLKVENRFMTLLAATRLLFNKNLTETVMRFCRADFWLRPGLTSRARLGMREIKHGKLLCML